MSKILAIIALMVTLAGTGLVVLLIRERDNMSDRLVQGEVEQKRLKAELLALRQERDRLLTRVQNQNSAVAASAPSDAIVASAPSGATLTKATGNGTQPAKPTAAAQSRTMLAEMMKNPAMRELVKQQQLAMLDSQYGALYEHFQFDDAEKAEFKRLLGERQTLQADLGFKLMAEGATKEQRDALVKEFEETKKTSDADIRNFFNSDDDYATFQRWEETRSDRMQLDMSRSQFTSSGEPLTSEQEQQLVDAMYQARIAPRNGKDITTPGVFDPFDFDDGDIGRMLTRSDNIARDVYQAASRFLTPKQLELLRNQQQQWRSMTEAGLRSSAAMFQSRKRQ